MNVLIFFLDCVIALLTGSLLVGCTREMKNQSKAQKLTVDQRSKTRPRTKAKVKKSVESNPTIQLVSSTTQTAEPSSLVKKTKWRWSRILKSGSQESNEVKKENKSTIKSKLSTAPPHPTTSNYVFKTPPYAYEKTIVGERFKQSQTVRASSTLKPEKTQGEELQSNVPTSFAKNKSTAGHMLTFESKPQPLPTTSASRPQSRLTSLPAAKSQKKKTSGSSNQDVEKTIKTEEYVVINEGLKELRDEKTQVSNPRVVDDLDDTNEFADDLKTDVNKSED
ncbi:hypothetical protein M3Y95_00901200 [Aphelenchoides besseyi]|nr:hypothetical protein M3Y95_00901200 [Aphelenchoides besseyi]